MAMSLEKNNHIISETYKYFFIYTLSIVAHDHMWFRRLISYVIIHKLSNIKGIVQ